MMPQDILKGLQAIEELLKAQIRLGKDGLRFIFEKGLWDEFIKYHSDKEVERNADIK